MSCDASPSVGHSTTQLTANGVWNWQSGVLENSFDAFSMNVTTRASKCSGGQTCPRSHQEARRAHDDDRNAPKGQTLGPDRESAVELVLFRQTIDPGGPRSVITERDSLACYPREHLAREA